MSPEKFTSRIALGNEIIRLLTDLAERDGLPDSVLIDGAKEVLELDMDELETFRDEIREQLTAAREIVDVQPIPIIAQVQALTYMPCREVDPEQFFQEKNRTLAKAAIRICSNCTVINECGEAAIDRDEKFGIWGGLTSRERRQMKRATSGASRS